MTTGMLGAPAVVVLEGGPPVTPSYVVVMTAWEMLCIMVWWLLWRPRS